MNDNEKYYGFAKERKINDSFLVIAVSFTLDNLKEMLAYATQNNGWINLDIKKRKTPSEKGYTHSIKLNEWGATTPKVTTQTEQRITITDADLPADNGEDEMPF